MRQMAHQPHSGRPLEGEEVWPPRELTDSDVQLLRDPEGAWNPLRILARFGPAREEANQLGHLLVGCAVLAGAYRIRDMAERLVVLAANALPRVRRLLENDALRSRQSVLQNLVARLHGARQELASTRAHAANDQGGRANHPDGLRFVDLDIIRDHIRTQVTAHEVVSAGNAEGIDFGLRCAERAPRLEDAERWLKRLIGTTHLEGILLFWPRTYGRVVLVYEDGRLAYDPGAPFKDETLAGPRGP